MRATLRPRLEALETRNLLSPVVHIDSGWVQQAGGGPILLNMPNTAYVLDTDIDVAGTAFVVGAANVSLDLNGHTVVYGDISPIQVTNGGFEQGNGTWIPGWDVSGAPAASKVPAMVGMYGQWMVQFTNFTTTQTIVSDLVSIPEAYHEYAALITPKGPYGSTVKLTVLDGVTGQVLGTGTSADPDRGFAAVAVFTPMTTDPIRLRVDVSPPPGQSATVALDYAAVVPSRDYGIMATQVWSGQLPYQLQTSEIVGCYRLASNFTVRNGQVVQGHGQGRGSSPLYFEALPGFGVSGVHTFVTGPDTDNLNANWASNALVTYSTFDGAVDRVSNRMDIVAALYLNNFDGSAWIVGNHIANVPQVGILVAGLPSFEGVAIRGNDIRQDTLVTDGYGILFAGVRNFDVGFNTIIPVNGRGILFDGWGRIATENGTVHDNYVEIHERPNLEYGDKLEATALRIRNYSSTFRNLVFIHNVFFAWTGPGLVYAAQGMRISQMNDQGQLNGADNRIEENYFEALVLTADPYFMARAVSVSQVDAGTGLRIASNLMESNDGSLAIGDTDSWNGSAQDIWMGRNTLCRTTEGALRAFTSVVAGAYQTAVSDIAMPDTVVEDGAPAEVTYGGGPVTNLRILWQFGSRSGSGRSASSRWRGGLLDAGRSADEPSADQEAFDLAGNPSYAARPGPDAVSWPAGKKASPAAPGRARPPKQAGDLVDLLTVERW
jgi:hypothetical protein